MIDAKTALKNAQAYNGEKAVINRALERIGKLIESASNCGFTSVCVSYDDDELPLVEKIEHELTQLGYTIVCSKGWHISAHIHWETEIK